MLRNLAMAIHMAMAMATLAPTTKAAMATLSMAIALAIRVTHITIMAIPAKVSTAKLDGLHYSLIFTMDDPDTFLCCQSKTHPIWTLINLQLQFPKLLMFIVSFCSESE